MGTVVIENNPVPQNFWPKAIEDKHYRFGSSKLPKIVLMPDGHGWKDFRPVGETQLKNGLDPQSCPAGGTLNAIEGMGLKQYKNLGFQSDLSERYLSIMMGMTGSGGWPYDAANTIRLYSGSIPEVSLPFDTTIKTLSQYFFPRPMTYALFKIGQHWNKVYDFGFEWVYTPEDNLSTQEKNNRMMEALKYSRLGVAGYAWSLHSDGKYYNDGPSIHWYDVDDYLESDYWDAFDTYPPYGKRLDWNYSPTHCMRYSLTRRPGAENVVYNPDDAEDCRIEYAKYLLMFFISKFKLS